MLAPPGLLLGALGQANGLTRQRVDGATGNGSSESGSVASSGAQPLLDNSIVIISIRMIAVVALAMVITIVAAVIINNTNTKNNRSRSRC